jgi:hypothetical protein
VPREMITGSRLDLQPHDVRGSGCGHDVVPAVRSNAS